MEHLNIGLGLAWYAVFVLSTTFHEYAHGFTAKKFGDPTAYHHGLVTLDPIPHIQRSPFGMVIIPIISFMLNGWMLGWASAPYDPYWERYNRKKAALMAMAGPAANLTLVIIAGLLIRIGILVGYFQTPLQISITSVVEAVEPGFANAAAIMLSVMFSLNLILCIFNLIPLPPLDGSGAITYFLSDEAADKYEAMLAQPGIRVVGLIIAWQIFAAIYWPIHSLALNILYYPIAHYG
ncbi:MAG: site-2 protease family protein [Planctomycetota bacterium]|jgi:Zn-dependent protease